MGYISTQPDKLRTALDGLIQLMDRLPMDESFFDAAKDKILRQCRTSKLKEEDRYFVWRTLQRLGLNRESRELIYEELPSIDSGKFLNLSAEHTAGKPQIILII